MIGIVSFDFFPPEEYYEQIFTEMPSWSPNFEWLQYESINFVDNMGSILILYIVLLGNILLVLIVNGLRARCCTKCNNKCCPNKK